MGFIYLNIFILATACILFEIMTLNILFQGKSEGDQLVQIFKQLGSPNEATLNKLKKNICFETDIFE